MSKNNAPRRTPLRVMFFTTSMPIGGAETLLVNLIRRLDRTRMTPELCCLKQLGPLGEELAAEIPVHAELLSHKFDVRVLWRLRGLLKKREIDAVVTVGAGDKMFWGRLAAHSAGVPVICSALHSTGWPDGVGRLNRLLTPITDSFIGVAVPHGRHLVQHEGFPASRVVVIPNGVDTERFAPQTDQPHLREELCIPDAAPVAIIVAALRPEKNHMLYLDTASQVLQHIPNAVFLVVGDGPERSRIEQHAAKLGISTAVRMLGSRSDIPQLLNLADVNVLTSHNEANPVSILEAMSTATATVATNVGSVGESVKSGETGFLAEAGDARSLAQHVVAIMKDPLLADSLGETARQRVVERWSLESMVAGYEDLITMLYEQKTGQELCPPQSLAQPVVDQQVLV